MTTAPAPPRTARLRRADVPAVVAALESDFGRLPQGLWDPAHHLLLDALDRGEHDRVVVHADTRIRAVAHLGMTSTVLLAGDPAAATALAPHVERSRWRIMIGDERITRALLEESSRSWFRKGPSTRIQRLMTAEAGTVARLPLAGVRRAVRTDLDALEHFACQLHVEDRMGPPLVGQARVGVRHRMAESVDRGMTWVVERDGVVAGKVDLSMHSAHRGAMLAGVYVRPDQRGRGVAAAMIAAVTAQLLDRGLPVVSLHVRDDNEPAIAAYRRAGFAERARWLLALR